MAEYRYKHLNIKGRPVPKKSGGKTPFKRAPALGAVKKLSGSK